MTRKTTTILGQKYEGTPRMNSPACRVWLTEQKMGYAAAERLLRAKNSIRKVWGQEPLNFQDDMTDLPMEGGFSFGRHRA